MALLIYAFKDGHGRWHGDPDVPLLVPDDEPGRGTLTYQPGPDTPETSNPFAGQTLSVLYGVVDLDESPVTYQLDTGGRFLASWHVHTLLATPLGAAPLAGAPTGPNDQPPCLETMLTEGGHRYVLTTTRRTDGQLTAELTVSTSQGDITAELRGTVTDDDLQPLARLLEAASRTLARNTALPAPRTDDAWTAADSAALAARFRQERDFGVLSTEFGRSRSAIYTELLRQELIRPPRPQPTAPARQAASTTSLSLQQRREVHRNSHARWSEEEEASLARRSAEGIDIPGLCEEFGRSERAIKGRLVAIDAVGPAADEARESIL
jgi:hypothetical protein